jgi:hypothetical protein
MQANAVKVIEYRAEELLPEMWRHFLPAGPVRAFNPGLLRDGDGWLFAYRIVGHDGRRRLAVCRLDRNLGVVAGSPVPLSDLVRFAAHQGFPVVVTQWFADPRLYRLLDRLFIYWNSGWHEPQNEQFLQELDRQTLSPIGPPRVFVLRDGGRQKLEKNWMLFEAPDGGLRAVYSVAPHRVLDFSLAGDGAIEFANVAVSEWTLTAYPACHGGLRGGAPPVSAGGYFWSFCHSVHDAPDGYRYAACVYRFASTPPFHATDEPISPLDLGRLSGAPRAHPRLNPAVGEVIYPCGAARDGDRWLLSLGVNDERAVIVTVEPAAILATLRAVAPR